jgi:hypothetical protein
MTAPLLRRDHTDRIAAASRGNQFVASRQIPWPEQPLPRRCNSKPRAGL